MPTPGTPLAFGFARRPRSGGLPHISPHLQVKLLRFLQERAFERVGGNESVNVDVRLLSATNRDLAQDVREGRFRVVLSSGGDIGEADLPFETEQDVRLGVRIPGSTMAEVMRHTVLATVEAAGSTVEAAQILGVSVRTLQYRLREYSSE